METEADYTGTDEDKMVEEYKAHLFRKILFIIFCLAHRYDIVACQEALEQYGLPLLGEGGRNA